MNEREYHRLKKQIEDDYRRKLDALEVVWAFASGLDAPGKAKSEKDERDDDEAGRKGVLASVEAVLAAVPEVFTTKDVEAQFGADDTPERSSISHALKRMTREGRLEIAEAGKGQRPTKYKKVASATNPSRPAGREMATEQDRQEIAYWLKEIGMEVEQFKTEFLSPFGAFRVLDLTRSEVNVVKEKLEAMALVEGPK